MTPLPTITPSSWQFSSMTTPERTIEFFKETLFPILQLAPTTLEVRVELSPIDVPGPTSVSSSRRLPLKIIKFLKRFLTHDFCRHYTLRA